jgi:catechol 2,3-dioxygenase-like lactoylglutathione lyase family enzyme
MLDHVTFGVADLAVAMAFYDAALAPLGISRLYGDAVYYAGYGVGARAFFWIGAKKPGQGTAHVAFVAQSRALVDGFYAAAIAAGGRCNGAPGVRAQYDPDYYGAFVLDADGHNVEAVCRGAPI